MAEKARFISRMTSSLTWSCLVIYLFFTSLERRGRVSINDSDSHFIVRLVLWARICEELTLTTVARPNRGLRPGSRDCKFGTLPLNYRAATELPRSFRTTALPLNYRAATELPRSLRTMALPLNYRAATEPPRSQKLGGFTYKKAGVLSSLNPPDWLGNTSSRK